MPSYELGVVINLECSVFQHLHRMKGAALELVVTDIGLYVSRQKRWATIFKKQNVHDSMSRRWIVVSALTFRLPVGLSRFPVHWVPGALCTELSRREHEVDYSPSVCVKNAWCFTYATLFAFVTCSQARGQLHVVFTKEAMLRPEFLLSP
jgi:hypothetical protein